MGQQQYREPQQEVIIARQNSDAPEMELPDDLSDQLRQSQKIRTKIVDTMTTGGTAIPRTEEEIKILLETLKQRDGVTLGEMKIKSDAKTNGIDQMVQEATRILNRTGGISHLPPALHAPVKRIIADSPELAPDLELVPEQDFIGQHNLTYDEFRERFEK